jgi:CBS domain containing-hemolysin-like protein
MPGILVTISVVVTLLIVICGLYVAGEFAAVSARKTRIVQAANEGSRLAKMLLPIIEDSHKLDNYIAASQVGITLTSIALGIYGEQQITPLIEPLLAKLPFLSSEAAAAGTAAILVLIVLTTLQVILSELVPKSIAIQYPEETALATVVPMRWSADYILRPLIILLNGSGVLLLKLLRTSQEASHRHVHSPEEIQFLIEQSHKGGLLDAEERELLGNALRVGELTVSDVVVPRTKMIAASADASVVDLLRLAASSHYTRIPVYEGDIDNIIGIVHLKDLFRLYQSGGAANVRTILRKTSFVPETMSVNDVWETLNRERTYLAIVFDEYGGTVGMVTREDLLEALFGEVQDEFDEDEVPLITEIGERDYLVRGDVSIAYLNSQLDLSLSAEHAHTISGLIVTLLERMPQVGDEVEFDGIRIRVQSVEERIANQLLLKLPGAPAEES